jgi:hypothetical protein
MTINQNRAIAIRALNERTKQRELLRSACFKEQLDFIDDPAKLKAAQCTRRAGKTYGCAGIYIVDTALWYPNSTLLYICTTRETARRILLKDVLYDIKRRFSIQMEVNLTSLTVTFPKSNSVLYLLGLDSKPEEADKALGQKYKLVVIDEGANWKQDQRHMVHSVLEPACADHEGTIAMLGAPANSLKTYFFDITGRSFLDPEAAKGWSVHKWGWWNNPFTSQKVQKQIDRMKERNPLIAETPIFQQMYLNKWVVDPDARVYKFTEDRNTATDLPSDHKWAYTLSLDLGYEDDSAFVVSACSDTHPDMFFVEAFKKKHQDITDIANILTDYRMRYPTISRWIVDGASKQAVQELVKRHGFPLVAADKRGKEDMIEIMNADYTTGRIKLIEGKCDPLKDEYGNLIWYKPPNGNPRVEHPSCPNHCADAALYGWRANYHYAAKEKTLKVKPGSPEAMEEWWDREAARAERRKRGEGSDFVKSDWGKEYG